MFMRFYGLETIHSNDKNGSRCEIGKSEYVRVFLLAGSCILASCAGIALYSKKRQGKEKCWMGKVLYTIS